MRPNVRHGESVSRRRPDPMSKARKPKHGQIVVAVVCLLIALIHAAKSQDTNKAPSPQRNRNLKPLPSTPPPNNSNNHRSNPPRPGFPPVYRTHSQKNRPASPTRA